LPVTQAESDSTCTASYVISFEQGLRKNGTVFLKNQGNPEKAVGLVENNTDFVSLGFGGEIILQFDPLVIYNHVGADFRIITPEQRSNEQENVKVAASKDGIHWIELGTAESGLQFDLGILDWARFVRLTDITSPQLFSIGSANGFDLAGIESETCALPSDFSFCWGVDVIDYSQEQTDPRKALGLPISPDTPHGVSLGQGGEITLLIGQGAIMNTSGDDLLVFGGTPDSSAMVYASQDGENWLLLGSSTQETTFDIGTLRWAQYIKLVDSSGKNAFSLESVGVKLCGVPARTPPENTVLYDDKETTSSNNRSNNQGTRANPPAAFNTISALSDVPLATDTCYIEEVISYIPGFTGGLTAVRPEHQVLAHVIGEPIDTNEPPINFVSLGFTGSIIVRLDGAVYDQPGADIFLVESTWGDHTIETYPEFVSVSVSQDGENWFSIGTVGLDGPVDVDGRLPWFNYVLLVDQSNPANFQLTIDSDGWDLIGIHCVTDTPTPTDTPSDTPTPTDTPSDTPTPTDTPSDTPTPTDTPSDTPTPTDTPSDTPTPTDTPSDTPTPTDTPSDTPTPTDTPSDTPTPTDTPSDTPTPTDTPSDTPTPTDTPSDTPTPTDTPSDTPTPTDTPSDTPTPTDTPACINPNATRDLSARIVQDQQNKRIWYGIVTNKSTTCTYDVGMAAYNKINEVLNDQTLYDSHERLQIGAGETTLSIEAPDCASQLDVFFDANYLGTGNDYDRVPLVLPEFGRADLYGPYGVRYGSRLLTALHINGTLWCNLPPGTCSVPTPTIVGISQGESLSGIVNIEAIFNGDKPDSVDFILTGSNGDSYIHTERVHPYYFLGDYDHNGAKLPYGWDTNQYPAGNYVMTIRVFQAGRLCSEFVYHVTIGQTETPTPTDTPSDTPTPTDAPAAACMLTLNGLPQPGTENTWHTAWNGASDIISVTLANITTAVGYRWELWFPTDRSGVTGYTYGQGVFNTDGIYTIEIPYPPYGAWGTPSADGFGTYESHVTLWIDAPCQDQNWDHWYKAAWESDLQLQQTGTTQATVGELATYTITVYNAGPVNTEVYAGAGTIITDILPIGLDFVSASWSNNGVQGTCVASGNIVTCDIGALAYLQTATVTITTSISGYGTLQNKASVAATRPGDPFPTNNESLIETFIPEPSNDIESMDSLCTQSGIGDLDSNGIDDACEIQEQPIQQP